MANFRTKAKTGPPTPLVRPRPVDSDNFVAFFAEADGFIVYVHCYVLELIERESRRAAPDEAIGLLAGRTCQDPVHGSYTLVMAADGARGDEVEASPSHVRISADGNACVRRRLENSHPDREIVGWYHSHPRSHAQFSYVDVAEQSTWGDTNHVGIVFSGTDRNEPFGVYRGPESVPLTRSRTKTPARKTGQIVFSTERATAERNTTRRIATEQMQPESPHPSTSLSHPRVRALTASRSLRGWLADAAPRLLIALTALALAAGVFWLHVRVRSMELASGSARGTVLSLPTPAVPSERPLPEQPSRPQEANAVTKPKAGLDNQTALTDAPVAMPAGNPLKEKARRRIATPAKSNRPVKRDPKPAASPSPKT